jgi:four helix bundle protein
MADYNYRNLILWDKAQELCLAIIHLIGPLPRSGVNDVITHQIIRSSSSIAANVAEGHGRYTPGAHLYHLSIAKGSACETDSWLDLLRRSGLISAEQERPLHDLCMELVAMLTAKIRQLDQLRPSPKPRVPRAFRDEAEEEYIANPRHAYTIDDDEEVLGS